MRAYSGKVIGTTEKFDPTGNFLKVISSYGLMLGIKSPAPQKKEYLVVLGEDKSIENIPASEQRFPIGTDVDVFQGLLSSECCRKGETVYGKKCGRRLIDGKVLDKRTEIFNSVPDQCSQIVMTTYFVETPEGRVETTKSKGNHEKNDVVKLLVESTINQIDYKII